MKKLLVYILFFVSSSAMAQNVIDIVPEDVDDVLYNNAIQLFAK